MNGYYNIIANSDSASKKIAFEHQSDAFRVMNKVFTMPISGYKGTMVVLPTGGGKTFTAVRWLCNNVLSKNIKILWLAQSTYLLDQAFKSFSEEISGVADRDLVNVRVVSGSENHANVGTVALSDDVIICTTQTAILNYKSTALDSSGNEQKKPLGKFIDRYQDGELFIVMDEAHHTAAYGCRTMLTDISEHMTANLYILGLTATPFHNDPRISGWLTKIYSCGENGVSFKISEKELQSKNILAVPKYIQKDTNIKMTVDDKTYKRLQKDHKDLPEDIIDELSKNNDRNTLIANDYLQNRATYGKTIIFADRWVQCESIVSKLNSNGVRADAVYSKVEKANLSANDQTGRTRNTLNKIAMEKFRANELDVIVNVKMLTEGVDVPDVRTVMLTRQTTSPILFTQMVGRALRGKGAGGGDDKFDANVVLFVDEWERFIDFKSEIGDAEEITSAKSHTRINDLISIDLVKRACNDLPFDELLSAPTYLSLIPIGWYAALYTKVISDDSSIEETITINEAIPVYDVNEKHFSNFLNGVDFNDIAKCEDERISDGLINYYAQKYLSLYFNEKDNIGNNLLSNLASMLKAMAQNRTPPPFVAFEGREYHDLQKVALESIDSPDKEILAMVHQMIADESRLWKILYKRTDVLFDAIKREQKRILFSDVAAPVFEKVDEEPKIDWQILRQEVLQRDAYTCQCCGKQTGPGIQLEIDHIVPHNLGGRSVLDNLQTLCKQCNTLKNVNTIDFRITKTPLTKPLPLVITTPKKSDYISNYIARLVNSIYYCKAFCSVKPSAHSLESNNGTWEIILYDGNNPEWLLAEKDFFIKLIHDHWHPSCQDIIVHPFVKTLS